MRTATPAPSTSSTSLATPADPAICAVCGATLVDRRWTRSVTAGALLQMGAKKPVDVRICPTCQRRRTGLPSGYVHLTGDFVHAHRRELEDLLRGEADLAHEDTPLAHVLTWDDDGAGGIMLTTTTEHLAHRLGHALQRAFHGELHHGFGHGTKIAHVWWRR